MKGQHPMYPCVLSMGGSLAFLHLVSSISELVEILPDSVNQLNMCPSLGDF